MDDTLDDSGMAMLRRGYAESEPGDSRVVDGSGNGHDGLDTFVLGHSDSGGRPGSRTARPGGPDGAGARSPDANPHASIDVHAPGSDDGHRLALASTQAYEISPSQENVRPARSLSAVLPPSEDDSILDISQDTPDGWTGRRPAFRVVSSPVVVAARPAEIQTPMLPDLSQLFKMTPGSDMRSAPDTSPLKVRSQRPGTYVSQAESQERRNRLRGLRGLRTQPDDMFSPIADRRGAPAAADVLERALRPPRRTPGRAVELQVPETVRARREPRDVPFAEMPTQKINDDPTQNMLMVRDSQPAPSSLKLSDASSPAAGDGDGAVAASSPEYSSLSTARPSGDGPAEGDTTYEDRTQVIDYASASPSSSAPSSPARFEVEVEASDGSPDVPAVAPRLAARARTAGDTPAGARYSTRARSTPAAVPRLRSPPVRLQSPTVAVAGISPIKSGSGPPGPDPGDTEVEDIDAVDPADRARPAKRRADSDALAVTPKRTRPGQPAPDRVLAPWYGENTVSYYPARVVDYDRVRAQLATVADRDEVPVTVRFDDDENEYVRAVKYRQLRALELRTGAIVRVNRPGLRTRQFTIVGAERVGNGTKTCVYGNDTAVLAAKPTRGRRRPAIAAVERCLVAELVVPATNIGKFPATDLGVAVPAVATTPTRRPLPSPDADAAAPVRSPTRERTSGLFAGMAFAASGFDGRARLRDTVRARVVAGGGEFLDNGLGELFATDERGRLHPVRERMNGLKFACVISDGYSQRIKYMQALALGLPCLWPEFVLESAARGSLERWREYVLPSGRSSLIGGMVRRMDVGMFELGLDRGWSVYELYARRVRLLLGRRVLVALEGRSLDDRLPVVGLLSMMGPDVLAVAPDLDALDELVAQPPGALVCADADARTVALPGATPWEARDTRPAWDYVYADEGLGKQAVQSLAGSVRVVDRDWVIETLVAGRPVG
ncbi:uncharacterized protein V1510DRAFT_429946 [Dipodascopsis tothii]|uniref:uncharacterized protein n=1 Tax=Dipodascopsis tothii TaxID=44089 RepID=UPI0034CF7706